VIYLDDDNLFCFDVSRKQESVVNVLNYSESMRLLNIFKKIKKQTTDLLNKDEELKYLFLQNSLDVVQEINNESNLISFQILNKKIDSISFKETNFKEIFVDDDNCNDIIEMDELNMEKDNHGIITTFEKNK